MTLLASRKHLNEIHETFSEKVVLFIRQEHLCSMTINDSSDALNCGISKGWTYKLYIDVNENVSVKFGMPYCKDNSLVF